MDIRFKKLLLFLNLVAGFGVIGENVLPTTSYCYDGDGQPTRCEPPRRSFSLDIIPVVNSTCGDPPAMFCYRQVDQLRQIFTSDCTGVCNQSDPRFSHNAEHMTDFLLNEESWWQSENSASPQQVVKIDIALGTMVEISVIAFNFISPLPNNFYIWKSNDFGKTYVPFHYFSSFCVGTYGINPDQLLNSDNETSALCQPIPYLPTPGQISFFPAVGRPSNNDSVPGFSEQLYNFITATNISIILVEHYAIDNREIEDFGYYYAIEDLSIIGSCQCHGHASFCSRDPSSGTYQCKCQHNTTGTFCERCADLYQDVPWQRADGNGPFECQKCDCNNHSTLCEFNETVYELNNRTSGGICINCMHNTSGRHCENCATYFYPRQGISVRDPAICTACDCNIPGVTNDGDCARESSKSGVQIGDCVCKENVGGRTCSECLSGYFNLSLANPQGCQACECNGTGSMGFECDALTGECSCKPNVTGSKCNLCMEGFYMPDPSSFSGCQPCECNPGGSSSRICDMNSGQCFCQPGLTGRTCSDVIPGYFFPSIDYLLYEAEYAEGVSNAFIVTNGDSGYYQVIDQASNVTFGPVIPPESGFYDIVIRYDLEGIPVWSTVLLTISVGPEEGDNPTTCESSAEFNGTMDIEYTSWSMGFGLSISQRICLQGGRSYRFVLNNFDSGQMNSTANLRIDSLVLIFVNASTLYERLGAQTLLDYGICASYFRSLSTIGSISPSCQQTIFLVSTALHSGAIRCNCSAVGTIAGQMCIAFGGQCPCLPNVQGQQCSICYPGFHSLSSSGCSACGCNLEGSSNDICDTETGMCDCLNNIVGLNCSECAENYWGFSSGDGCKECSCNMIGAVSQQCDTQSGLCICKSGVGGANCSTCQQQYFGFSQIGCSSCLCSVSGSLSLLCNDTSGQCQCKKNVRGRDCSQCIEGTYNLQQSNPSGCQPCFCSGQSINCTSASGYVATVISTRFNESTIQGWTTIDNSTSVSYNSSVGIILGPNTTTYLQAPSIFVGNKLSSYNQYITVAIDSSNTNISTTVLPADVVLLSKEARIGANYSMDLLDAGLTLLRVHLHETAGWIDMTSNLLVNASALQLVLSCLNNLYITASYSDLVVINAITLDTTEQSSIIDDEVSWVEQCSCPPNYNGLSCEQCADGYTRSSTGSCVPCQCNGFSDSCDPETGVCTDCDNYTSGNFCEVCQSGTYGNPLQQIPCQLCPCPLTSEPGQFSTNCTFNVTLGQVICFNCPPGHTGLQCETCISGYFGDPTGDFTGVPTACSDCQCNGNIDHDNPEACNKTSGICLQCLSNTYGDQCEICADGYYGDAVTAKNCSVCDCNSQGSNSTSCDPTTGECFCFPNVIGRRCTECADGNYGYGTTLGCLPCDCHPEGAESTQCDRIGQCRCKAGVSGLKCDQCTIGYFGLSSEGCRECLCVVSNSVSELCDENGSCNCQFGAAGGNCSQCLLNYFQTNEGCVSCPDCYQELEQLLLWIKQSFNDSFSKLQLIVRLFGNEESAFSDQLIDAQEQSIEILSLVNNTLTEYYSITVQYEHLKATLNDTLLSQMRQIEVDLSNLRSVSTTVLVLASTSEELMDRTTTDFVNTQQVVEQILQSTTIIEIIQALNMIEEKYMFVSSIAEDLFNSSQMLSFQIMELNDLIDSTLIHSKSAVNMIQYVQDVITHIESISDNLKMKSISLSSAIQLSKGEVTMLLKAVTSLGNMIQQQATQLPYYAILQVNLNNLSFNATDAKNHAIIDIIPEIDTQFNQYSAIYRIIGLSMESLNKLESNVTTLTSRLSNANMELTFQEMKTEQDLLLTLATINHAQEILWKLQNFSSESLSIGEDINQADTDIQLIKAKAREIQNQAGSITGSIEQANADAQGSMQISTSVKTVTNEIEQIISSLDLPVPLRYIHFVEQNEDSIEELIVNASRTAVLQKYVISNVSRIDQIKLSTENGTFLSDSLENINSSTTDVVKKLQANQDRLQTPLQNATAIELLLEQLDHSLTVYNARTFYQDLQNTLATQELVRKNLETTLLTLQEQINYLEHVHSLLPEDCT